MVWSPLDAGWLSGRYRTTADLIADSRVVRLNRRSGASGRASEPNVRKLDLVQRLAAIAESAGMPLAHLATAWTLVHPDVTSVIIGPRTWEQFEDSLAAADIELTDDVLDALDEVVPPGMEVVPDPTTALRELDALYRRGRTRSGVVLR